MVTLKLKKKPDSTAETPSGGSRRGPLRSNGLRQRPTLAQAQEERRQWDEAHPPRQPDRPSSPQPTRSDTRNQGRPWGPAEEDRRYPPDRRPARAAPARPMRREDERPSWGQKSGPSGPAPGAPRQAWAPPQRGTNGPTSPNSSSGGTYNRSSRPSAPARPDGLRSVANPQWTPKPESAPPAKAPLAQPLSAPSGEGERLSKRMAALGLASRREADEWIEAGWVLVNGKMAVLGQRVTPSDAIVVDPAAHKEQAQRVTILLNKPVGYVSGQPEDGYEPAAALLKPENHWSEDRSGRRWHPGHLRGLAPAGRLDIDSVGLLVLTQDGRVAKQLIGEDSGIEKEYLVRVAYGREGRLPDADLALLQHGLELDGQALKPAKVSWQNEDQLRFVLKEGKKRQIRRMCEAVGLQVLGLKRVRIGSVVLGKLPPGQWRYLCNDEFFG